ncbi:HNH endonuclease [Pseudomonas sp. SWRI74]|uniref:HNH endonuclease n=1 Tax=Pseudomonas azerbaijanoccidentalis TaxID=2842347 RepID=A0ABS6QUP3_9PSED|nr:HNH endonuclease [Pseudomonas azerbaijanoccidentalis]
MKRVTIPKWVRRAVFYRDRGRCVLCDKDLFGQINLENHKNYDHIVPLAKHGLNDTSNIQLLCKECNQMRSTPAKPSHLTKTKLGINTSFTDHQVSPMQAIRRHFMTPT